MRRDSLVAFSAALLASVTGARADRCADARYVVTWAGGVLGAGEPEMLVLRGTSECGDGVVEGPEECDDGNAVLNDGCSFCSLETLFGGGGAEETDCNLAWGVAGVPAAPAVGCTDGDASCDQGSSAGECAVHVTLCLNVAARLATRCVPSGIARVALAAESLAGPAALEPSAQAAVLDPLTAALEWAPGTTVVREGTTLTATPPMTRYADVCRPLAVVVPARATRTVALLVTDPQERVDADAIAFSCAPA